MRPLPTHFLLSVAFATTLAACGAPETAEVPGEAEELASEVSALEQTFTAVADARVDAASPSSNFGTAPQVRVDGTTEGEPSVTSYLRFNVSGVSGSVYRAVLRLYVHSGTANGPRLFPTSNEWSESTLTWNNAPAATGDFVADAEVLATGTWTELDVTRHITGNGTYSFLLRTTLTDGSDYASRESGANAPRLVLTTLSTPASTGTTFYVSRTGSNGDGRSPATAWSELNKVQWSSIKPGDTLVIQGGTYRTRLTVGASGALGKPITLRASGKVVIDGGRNTAPFKCGGSSFSAPSSARAPAIDLYGRKYIVMDGGSWSGITVKNWYIPYDSINAAVDARGTSDITLRNLEVSDNSGAGKPTGTLIPTGHGFNVQDSQRVTVERLIAHDNGNDTFRSSGSLKQFRVSHTWAYNSNDDTECAHPDVLQLRDHGEAVDVTFENSVFGPNLHHVVIIEDQSRVEKIQLKNVLAHHLFASVVAIRQSLARAVTIDRLTSHLEWSSPPNLELSGGPTSSSEPRHIITQTLTKGGDRNSTPSTSSKVSCSNSYQDYGLTGGGEVICAKKTLRFADEDAAQHGGDLRYANFRPLNTDLNGAGSTLYSAQDLLAR